MDKKNLIDQILKKKSYLCVGLDSEMSKIPEQFLRSDDPVFEFNKSVIDATKEFTVAYKINIAFYESLGYKGWQSLENTLSYLPEDVLRIADAKRGDIGNTSRQYAKTFFETYSFDAITVSPYMGIDSISPFFEYPGKWVIILALTSNKGSADFQMLQTGKSKVFEEVIIKSSQWGNTDNTMYVIGATHPEAFAGIRKLIPNHFILIPGVGAQGGDLEMISQNAINEDIGILVNVSRAIIFPEVKTGFQIAVHDQAKWYRDQMALSMKL
jgi:orotidine-5'-phosphate decarboxylase